jgi:hypothetical protein
VNSERRDAKVCTLMAARLTAGPGAEPPWSLGTIPCPYNVGFPWAVHGRHAAHAFDDGGVIVVDLQDGSRRTVNGPDGAGAYSRALAVTDDEVFVDWPVHKKWAPHLNSWARNLEGVLS